MARLLCGVKPRWEGVREDFRAHKRQDPAVEGGVLSLGKEPDDYLLSHGQSALSSAWSRFTVLFGMGRGGTDSLWSSGMTGCCVARVGVNLAPQPIGKKRKGLGMCCLVWHNIDLKPV